MLKLIFFMLSFFHSFFFSPLFHHHHRIYLLIKRDFFIRFVLFRFGIVLFRYTFLFIQYDVGCRVLWPLFGDFFSSFVAAAVYKKRFNKPKSIPFHFVHIQWKWIVLIDNCYLGRFFKLNNFNPQTNRESAPPKKAKYKPILPQVSDFIICLVYFASDFFLLDFEYEW